MRRKLRFKLKKGLDLPISGAPEQRIDVASPVKSVAILGRDYVGLKPTMLVAVGDVVKAGQPVFEDKKNPGVIVTSPGAGKIVEINRGEKRVLLSVVIELSGDANESFESFESNALAELDEVVVRRNLQKSGLWVALRSRPYSKVPAVDADPSSIFVNVMDSNPLSADPAVVLEEQHTDFNNGVSVLGCFNKPVYLCCKDNAKLPSVSTDRALEARFSGPHPAGLPGTHIHFIDPVNINKSVWYIGYQDVVAIGKLFTTGLLSQDRIIALAGPAVRAPRLLKTRIGASVDDLTTGRTRDGELRPISGSVLSGYTAIGEEAWLGRYHTQLSVLTEGRERDFMGWIAPGLNKFSATNVLLSSLFRSKRFGMNTNKNGSPRAMVPIGVYESVMPLDVLATPILKALLVNDTDTAQALGALELDEEDLALCSFVDPSKHDFGSVLRKTLVQIERDG